MIETRLPEVQIDPVTRRLQRIVEAKRIDNERALGVLDQLEADWTNLNKEIDGDINAEFEYIGMEQQAADEAVRDLQEQRAKPVAGSFVVAGKVLERKDQVGLPGLLVRVEATIRNQPTVLTEVTTSSLGGFIAKIGSKELAALEDSRSLSFAVYSDPETLLHTVDQEMAIKAGRVEQLTIVLRQVDDLSNRLAAGRAVRDSVHDNAAVLSARADNMRASHTEIAKLAELSRAELKTLRDDLAQDPPEIATGRRAAPPEVQAPARPATRFLGNASSRELHDLANESGACQINEIRFDHRVPFDDIETAVEAGYDFCAHCFGKERSKR